jgi:hypothetical protein
VTPETRALVYGGAIEVVRGTTELETLITELWSRLRAHFAPIDPLLAYDVLGNDAFFERFAPLRRGIPHDEQILALALHALSSLGVELGAYRVDRPRLRAVSSGAHDVPAAAPAYGQHRDTWYANPQAQVNHWIPLHDVLDAELMGFFPAHFDAAVENTSAGFSLDGWKARGGFQAYAKPQRSEQFHPTPVHPLPWHEATRLRVPRGSLLRFSGQHLHGTVPHRSGRTRYTLELRIVHEADHTAGIGAPDVDDASLGDASEDYLPCARRSGAW